MTTALGFCTSCGVDLDAMARDGLVGHVCSTTPRELVIGAISFVGEPAGAHVHVQVRGHGQPGSRPLLGTLMMDHAEWRGLFVAAQRAQLAKEIGEHVRSFSAVTQGQLDALAELE